MFNFVLHCAGPGSSVVYSASPATLARTQSLPKDFKDSKDDGHATSAAAGSGAAGSHGTSAAGGLSLGGSGVAGAAATHAALPEPALGGFVRLT